MISATQKQRRFGLAMPAVLFIAVLMGGPMLIMVFVSLVERAPDGGVVWGRFTTAAYTQFFYEENLLGEMSFNTDYMQIYLRSIYLSGFTVLATFVVGFPTAMYIAMQEPRRRALLIFFLSLPFWVNLLVRNYAWLLLLRANGLLDQVLMGLWITSEPLNILYTNTAIAIGLTYSFLPLMVLPVYAAMEKFDFSLVEAAFDLGANRVQALLHVIFPGVKGGIIAGCLLVFIPCLGSYVTPVLLGGSKSLMIGNLIQAQFSAARNWPFGAALAFVLLLMVIMAAVLRAVLLRGRNRREL
ncbi:ABC transporter permease [Sulfitobacter pacificus]|uniref:ABC transporter permease n=1 Tax=Sulfitobacter pacificus TaxID=1499314 RepID=UPI0031069F15